MSLKGIRAALVLAFVCGTFVGFAEGQTPEQRTRNPHGQITLACQNCHTATNWKPIRAVPEFDHNTQTRYPLRAMHQSVRCESCHVQPVFTKAATTCASCHADIHRRQFGSACDTCHTVRGWRVAVDAVRQHTNRFPLAGAHAAAECESCHKGAASGTFTGLSTACVSCHLRDYEQAKAIDHRASGLPTRCESCHGMNRWQDARFDHNTATRFPLSGAHTAVQCSSCHAGGRFAGTPTTCAGCHTADFARTKNPDHQRGNFPTTCESCHTTAGWSGAAFDHNVSRFALTGAHLSVACASCHIGGRLTGTPSDCFSCHTNDFNSTRNPNHAAAGFSTSCTACHSTSGWAGAQIDHAKTRFPLTGAHSAVACATCHVGNRFAGTPQTCSGCHTDAFNKTTNPNHVAAGFPADCTLCHSTAAWQPASFDHSRTRFPLTGAHTSVTCATCHKSGTYAGLNTACAGCHIGEFNATTSPNHLAAAFPQDCQVCHNTTQWRGATFDHSRTRFALTGAHQRVSCANCHIGGRYAGTPSDCNSCHAGQFTSVTNPNHVAAGFPRTCETCHTTTTWSGARFTHRFPIYSGSHAGKWTTCNDCHTNASNYTVFSCINCHAHDKAAMDSRHRNQRGYAYNSLSCYGCHPNGRE